MANLTTEKSLDKHLKPVKSGEENTSLELATEGNGVKVTGDLEVNNDILLNGDLNLNTTKSLNLDNAGRTYITQSSADTVDFMVDNKRMIRLDESSDTITLSSGNLIAASSTGTEYSAANSAYAGMILGYTRLEGDGSNTTSHEIQNSMTVEDSTHQITFKTPPSENVEIETTFLINASSTDTRIDIGLSDNATYNSIGIKFEYDNTGIAFGDDEVDDGVRTVKWVLGASELASVGSSNTFYIGFSTSGVTKTAYLTYGYRTTHGIAEHPFVIKATALPTTIYDGT